MEFPKESLAQIEFWFYIKQSQCQNINHAFVLFCSLKFHVGKVHNMGVKTTSIIALVSKESLFLPFTTFLKTCKVTVLEIILAAT